MVSNEKRFQLDRRLLCTDGIIASFFLSTWSYYSVGCIGLVRVEDSSFITAFGSLIAIYPDEPSCKQGIGTPAIPKVAQAGSSALSAMEDPDGAKDLADTFKELQQTPDYNTAMMNLKSGLVDAVAIDIGVAQYYLSQQG